MRGEVGDLELGGIGAGLLNVLPRRAAGLAATSEVTPAIAVQCNMVSEGKTDVSGAKAAARTSLEWNFNR